MIDELGRIWMEVFMAHSREYPEISVEGLKTKKRKS
jgi:hypothetical protein